jgi:transcriptional regulator with XRE-family HTH domain
LKEELLIALGKKIKEICLQKQIMQTQIAYCCGFYKSNCNTISAGKSNPTIALLLKIAKALEVTILELFQF